MDAALLSPIGGKPSRPKKPVLDVGVSGQSPDGQLVSDHVPGLCVLLSCKPCPFSVDGHESINARPRRLVNHRINNVFTHV